MTCAINILRKWLYAPSYLCYSKKFLFYKEKTRRICLTRFTNQVLYILCVFSFLTCKLQFNWSALVHIKTVIHKIM